jgi:hypothetical protein
MDVRGRRNPAEVIADAVLEALSGLNITNNNNIINNMNGEQISKYVNRKRLKMITSFK